MRLIKPKPRKVQKFPEFWWDKMQNIIILQYDTKSSIAINEFHKKWVEGFYYRHERIVRHWQFEFIGEIEP
jgi:hypothetical protein